MRKNKKNKMMYLACILLCLTLISTYMTSGLYARYTAEGSGSDSARVAKFDVEAGNMNFSEQVRIDLAPGSIDKEVLVTNKSEVVVKCIWSLDNKTGNLPLQMEVKSLNGQPAEGVVIPPGGQQTYRLTVNWEAAGAQEYMGMVDLINVEMRAEQVD